MSPGAPVSSASLTPYSGRRIGRSHQTDEPGVAHGGRTAGADDDGAGPVAVEQPGELLREREAERVAQHVPGQLAVQWPQFVVAATTGELLDPGQIRQYRLGRQHPGRLRVAVDVVGHHDADDVTVELAAHRHRPGTRVARLDPRVALAQPLQKAPLAAAVPRSRQPRVRPHAERLVVGKAVDLDRAAGDGSLPQPGPGAAVGRFVEFEQCHVAALGAVVVHPRAHGDVRGAGPLRAARHTGDPHLRRGAPGRGSGEPDHVRAGEDMPVVEQYSGATGRTMLVVHPHAPRTVTVVMQRHTPKVWQRAPRGTRLASPVRSRPSHPHILFAPARR